MVNAGDGAAMEEGRGELVSSDGQRVCVRRSKPARVLPARQSVVEGDGVVYYLCNLDQNVAVMMESVHFYTASKEKVAVDHPGGVLRKALEEVLVYYYPLAGKLGVSKEGKLEVICSDEGVVFLEAEADVTLSHILVGEDERSSFDVVSQLICPKPTHAISPLDIPLCSIQVTRFKCGSFSVGMSMNHGLSDGASASRFLISWGETARGLPLSMPPALDRTMLRSRNPLNIEFPHQEFSEIEDVSHTPHEKNAEIVFSSFCFNCQALALLKQQILNEGVHTRCSSFTALTAFLWRSRTQALGVASTQETKLLFAVDGISKFQPPLPKAFFGNSIVLTCAVASAGELTTRSLSYAVGLVQNAIDIVTDAFMRSAIDFYEKTRARPSLTSTLLITSWCTLPFRKADFGWGESLTFFPVGAPQPEVVFFLEDDQQNGRGIKVLMCLPPSALTEMQELIHQQLHTRCIL